MKRIKQSVCILLTAVLFVVTLAGCSMTEEKKINDSTSADNIIITETGDIVQKLPQPQATAEPEPTEAADTQTQPTAEPEVTAPDVQLAEPEQEQVITQEDQIEPTESELQIVFLGDSIFDNNRDGTGVPYLTAVQCEADVYNLAIAGTCATIESTEEYENEKWTSRGLTGIVKAMRGEISTDIFEGTRTKEILDNKKIDWSATDYFVIEYGINDFFKATPLSDPDDFYDQRTYAGALRYAITNLRSCAPDATIILCGPHYSQFFAGDSRFIGDGNTLNTGYGTLFDYKGICQYVSNEQETEFLDAYMDLGINSYSADQYLEDGVHLTQEGRQLYADALAKIILNYEETKNN